jgi:hypothetical protein
MGLGRHCEGRSCCGLGVQVAVRQVKGKNAHSLCYHESTGVSEAGLRMGKWRDLLGCCIIVEED